MLLSFLKLYRWRLITAAILSLAVVLLEHVIASANSFSDIGGVFWHSFCGCPPDPSDTRSLFITFPVDMFIFGIVFGFSNNTAARNALARNLPNETRFLSTRPVSRFALLAYPFCIATTAMVLLPLLAWALLLGWLKLVHAPSLGHLVALAELIPAAHNLGPHPSLLSLLSAIHFPRLYLAELSVGLAIYCLFSSQRWLILSPHKAIRLLAAFIGILIFFPFLLQRMPTIQSSVVLFPPHGQFLAEPSTLNVALHLAVAVAFLLLTYRTMNEAEL